MKKIMFLLGCLIAQPAFAAQLIDVKLLNAVTGREGLELKLRSKEGKADSYFFLEIVKSDPDSFEKMSHVVKKMKCKGKYKLDLDIPSFSLSPSGSHYKSTGIAFTGTPALDSDCSPPERK